MAVLEKRIIQVPVDPELLTALDRLSASQHKSRSEVIREACRRYIAEMEMARLEQVYTEGYRRVPEEPAWGQAQVAVAGQVLGEEAW